MDVFTILPGKLLFVFGVPLIVAAILILVAGRPDDDKPSTRTQARYLGTIGILTLFITLFAAFGVVRGLSDLLVDKGDDGGSKVEQQIKEALDQIPIFKDLDLSALGGGGGNRGGSDDADYRLAVQSGLLAIAAGAVFVFHERRARQLFARDNLAATTARVGATARVGRATLYGVAFVGAIVFLVSISKAGYGVFRIIAPGVTAGGGDDVERQRGIAEVISYGFLALGGGLYFRCAWRWLPEQHPS